jgi:hypothetical protein
MKRRAFITLLGGAAAAWPLAARAQQSPGKLPRVGSISNFPNENFEAFIEGLREAGGVDGHSRSAMWKTSTMASSGPRVNDFMGWWSSLRR